jgi:phage I-like protein
MPLHRVTLATASIDVGVAANDGAPLPTERRLFRWGINRTTKGDFIFDAESAAAIMAEYESHGVDIMFDLEHLSLDTESVNFDPDARAWAKLAVRGQPGDENGGLFAFAIRWTDDGETRLRRKTQRYLSPAFWADKDGRITELMNIALVAMPATHGTQALVAASKRRGITRMTFDTANAERMVAGMKANCVALSARAIKLADEAPPEGEQPAPQKGKVAGILEQMKSAQAQIVEVEKALKGKDIDAIFAAMASAAEVMKGFYESLEAFQGGAKEAAPPAPEPAPEVVSENGQEPAKEPEKMSAQDRDELIRLRAESAARAQHAKQLAEDTEAKARITALSALVQCGHVPPAVAWEHGVPGVVSKHYRGMSSEALNETLNALGKQPSVKQQGPQTPYATASGDEVELSQFEAERVKIYATKRREELTRLGRASEARSDDDVIARYRDHKRQQVEAARDTPRFAQLARGIRQEAVLLDSRGERLVALSGVAPIETFGTSSQRALEEFRLEYNMALSAEPRTWAEEIGNALPNGALKTTFPLNFDAVGYQKKLGENAPAAVAQTKDVDVTKEEFFAGKQVNLRRLQMGDFAYVQNWSQQAQQLARARVVLRNKLVAALLVANGTWTPDGQAFFSATHKVNPFDANIKLRTSATWSNYQVTGAPLAVGALSVEKATSIQVAQANGEELEHEYDAILVPSVLNETAKNILTVNEIILDAVASLNSVNNVMGSVKNPHFNSGLTYTKASQLPGSGSTADWYLYSRSAIAAGLTPWVISEDAADDMRMWDESSDFYKSTGDIKVTSNVYIAAAFMWPHSIRLVKGA